jgi:hypothetical protein
METAFKPSEGGRKTSDNTFAVEVGDKDFEFQQIALDDAKVTGAQIAIAAGKHPVENFVVLAQTRAGELETLRPTETTNLRGNGPTRFFVIKGSRTQRFFVEGLAMEWPHDKLVAWQIKLLAGAGEDHSLVLEREGADRVFEDNDEVDVGGNGVERFKLKKRKATVTVHYGDNDFELERRVYTTEELMAAFSVPAGYLLDFVSPDGVFREMVPGEGIKVKDGMEFASHPPVGQSS